MPVLQRPFAGVQVPASVSIMAGNITTAEIASLLSDTVHLSNRALPVAPTGYYDWQITVDTSDDYEGHSLVTNLLSRVEAFKAKGPIKPDPKQLVSIFFISIFCLVQC